MVGYRLLTNTLSTHTYCTHFRQYFIVAAFTLRPNDEGFLFFVFFYLFDFVVEGEIARWYLRSSKLPRRCSLVLFCLSFCFVFFVSLVNKKKKKKKAEGVAFSVGRGGKPPLRDDEYFTSPPAVRQHLVTTGSVKCS